MRLIKLWQTCFFICVIALLNGCATHQMDSDAPDSQQAMFGDGKLPLYHNQAPYSDNFNEGKYASMMPQNINLGHQKVIVVDPKVFAWGAYNENGELVRAGIASAGADYCPDDGGPCRTKVGTFRIYSLGNEDCRSRTYPRPEGGALMPYCMFFNGGESLHGSPDQMLVEANISHGCVHMRIPDAEWLRNNFATVGTKVVIEPY